jgi:hypothetical protein
VIERAAPGTLDGPADLERPAIEIEGGFEQIVAAVGNWSNGTTSRSRNVEARWFVG